MPHTQVHKAAQVVILSGLLLRSERKERGKELLTFEMDRIITSPGETERDGFVCSALGKKKKFTTRDMMQRVSLSLAPEKSLTAFTAD